METTIDVIVQNKILKSTRFWKRLCSLQLISKWVVCSYVGTPEYILVLGSYNIVVVIRLVVFDLKSINAKTDKWCHM